MLRIVAGCIYLVAFVVSSGVFAQNGVNFSVFLNKNEALDCIKKEEQAGNRANLTTQNQSKQGYTVYLKGYSQWSASIKHVQSLQKAGYKNLEVLKEQQGERYSILVGQFLNKEKAKDVFNKLHRSGLRNARIESDTINLSRYIVTIHQSQSLPMVQQEPSTLKPLPEIEIQSASKQAEVKVPDLEKEVDIFVVSDEDAVSDDELLIVMSDEPDIIFDFEMDENLEENSVDWAVDKVFFEEELFTRSSSDATNTEYIHVLSHVNWRLSENWDMQLAARIDAYNQHGKHGTDVSDTSLESQDSYIRYRNDSMRVTVGTQTIRWGRVDILAPTDNMVTLDLSRGVLPDWDELYRSSLAVRGEIFSGRSKLDLVYLPKFREAELAADKENVWYPINTRKGKVIGAKSNPISTIINKNARIDDHFDGGEGGFGLRFSSNINSIDYALSVQRVRLSAPSYKINEQFRQDLLIAPLSAIKNQSNYGYTYTEEHPRNWIVGGDIAFQWRDFTLRFEGAWFSDLPATTKSLEFKTYDGIRWASGVEFYPGDSDTRVILQLSGNHIDEKEKIVDRDNSVTLNGESESLFSNNRWRFSTKFSIGLDIKDIYISPEVSYLGMEPFEIYSAVHYLDGNEQSLGGFYQDNSMITIGWRGRY